MASGPVRHGGCLTWMGAWENLHVGAVWAEVDHVSSLRLTGSDRLAFLRGRVTAALSDASPGAYDRGLQLDVRGGALAQMALHVRDRDVHVAVDDHAGAWLARSWKSAVVFDDVEIHDLRETLVTLTVQGPETESVITHVGGTVPQPGRHVTVDVSAGEDRGPPNATPVLVSLSRRSAVGGVDVTCLRRDADGVVAWFARAGAVPIDHALLEASRIAASVPRAGTDAGAGVLPQEAGLADWVAVGKGCYLGQETMARVHARGRLKRGLVVLTLAPGEVAFEPSAVGRDVEADDTVSRESRTVGRMGGMFLHPEIGWIGLAVVRHDAAPYADLVWRGRPVCAASLLAER